MSKDAEVFRVLLVEDNPHVSELFNYAIRRLTHERMGVDKQVEIVVAVDGHSAWQHLADAAGGFFDLVVLDLHLPILDGIEVLGRVRSRDELSDLPVLVVTAADGETCEQARELGATDVLRKPIQISDIREALARIL